MIGCTARNEDDSFHDHSKQNPCQHRKYLFSWKIPKKNRASNLEIAAYLRARAAGRCNKSSAFGRPSPERIDLHQNRSPRIGPRGNRPSRPIFFNPRIFHGESKRAREKGRCGITSGVGRKTHGPGNSPRPPAKGRMLLPGPRRTDGSVRKQGRQAGRAFKASAPPPPATARNGPPASRPAPR